MASFAVKAIDHVVLTVKNIPATVTFYTTRLGMEHEKFSSKGDERYVHHQVGSVYCLTIPSDTPWSSARKSSTSISRAMSSSPRPAECSREAKISVSSLTTPSMMC